MSKDFCFIYFNVDTFMVSWISNLCDNYWLQGLRRLRQCYWNYSFILSYYFGWLNSTRSKGCTRATRKAPAPERHSLQNSTNLPHWVSIMRLYFLLWHVYQLKSLLSSHLMPGVSPISALSAKTQFQIVLHVVPKIAKIYYYCCFYYYLHFCRQRQFIAWQHQ